MAKKLANFISVALHPLLMSSILFIVLAYFAPTAMTPINETLIWKIMPLIFGATVVVPMISIAMMKFSSTIESFNMYKRSERLLPFSFITIFYGLTAYLFWMKIQTIPVITIIFFAITSTITAVTILTLYIKVSVHSAGSWGLSGFLLAFKIKYPESSLLWPLIISILLAGIVASSRLYLNAHNSKEVYLGAGLGFIISFLSIYLFI